MNQGRYDLASEVFLSLHDKLFQLGKKATLRFIQTSLIRSPVEASAQVFGKPIAELEQDIQ